MPHWSTPTDYDTTVSFACDLPICEDCDEPMMTAYERAWDIGRGKVCADCGRWQVRSWIAAKRRENARIATVDASLFMGAAA